MNTSTNRRRFLKTTAAATFGFQVVPSRVFGANSKVQLACVGVGGKGSSDIAGNQKAGAAVVGLCDIDRQRLTGSAKKYPGAKTFTDFREMYESLGDKFDAVTVSTPDHTHFHASLHAIRRGKHVYCQKPLTHSAWEARTLTEAAANYISGEVSHPDIISAHGEMAPISEALAASRKADAGRAQLAADQTLRHFIIEQALILNTAVPPLSSSDSDVLTESDTSDLYEADAAGFVADFVSGEVPDDQESEWEILGTRNRAALNQNFARELPLEYRATLKNYYERVAK